MKKVLLLVSIICIACYYYTIEKQIDVNIETPIITENTIPIVYLNQVKARCIKKIKAIICSTYTDENGFQLVKIETDFPGNYTIYPAIIGGFSKKGTIVSSEYMTGQYESGHKSVILQYVLNLHFTN